MKQIARLLIIALAGLLSHQNSEAQINPGLAAVLQAKLDSIRLARGFTGVSAAVLIPPAFVGSGIWRGVSGTSHGGVPLTPGMKHGISSNTKLFVSTLVLRFAELNRLKLDDSLHKWLPTIQYVNPNTTIRQLLNHTSGIYNFIEHPAYYATMVGDTGRFWAPESILTKFMNTPYFSPGDSFYYSNTNYLLAGMVIRRAADTSVSSVLRQLVLNPLALGNTFFPLEESVPDTIAHGWGLAGEFAYPWSSWTSSQWCFGNMYSTAGEMVRWYDSLFSGRIINSSSLSQMLTWVPNTPGYLGYGLGVYRVRPSGRTKWQHDGLTRLGYRSVTRIDSAARYVVSVIINQYVTDTNPNVFEVANLLDNAVVPWLVPVAVTENAQSVPDMVQLRQNYPNPFNPSTTIQYQLPKQSHVGLKILDLLGREVATLVNEVKKPGSYEVIWDASGLASGVYLYRLDAGAFSMTRKLVLLR